MRDKRAAKCFKYNNNNLVLMIICFSRFVSLVSLVSVVSVVRFARFVSVVSFRWFRSLFRVLVHAQDGSSCFESEIHIMSST